MDNQNELNNSLQDNVNYGKNNQQNNFILNPIIDSLSGWMKFIGICTIVSGALTCLGVITAAIGIPIIFSGIALTRASKSIKTYKQYNSPYMLNEIFTSMNKYFKIQGILSIIGIVLFVIYVLIIIFGLVLSIYSFY